MSNASVTLVAATGSDAVVATLLPHGGTPRDFKILVNRQPSKPMTSGGFAYGVNVLEIFVPRDPVDGMMIVNERKDRIRFKKRLSDSEATEFTINKVVQEDAGIVSSDLGGFTLEVRA